MFTFKLKLIAFAVITSLLFSGYFFWKAKVEADLKIKLEQEANAKRIEALKKRNAIDEKVFKADDNDLCVLLGGCELPDN